MFQPKNIIIADDHELFRKGLAELLRKHNDIEVVKSVSDGVEFLQLINNSIKADIVLKLYKEVLGGKWILNFGGKNQHTSKRMKNIINIQQGKIMNFNMSIQFSTINTQPLS